MTKANHAAREAEIRNIEIRYVEMRNALKRAARNACWRMMIIDCPCGFDSQYDNAMDRIDEDWPEDRQAFYIHNGRVYPSWINWRNGRNYIKEDIAWWDKD